MDRRPFLHTHNWRIGEASCQKILTGTTPNPRGHMDRFFKLCKTAEFPKREFGTGNQIRDDGEVTQVSLMRAHRGSSTTVRVKNLQ